VTTQDNTMIGYPSEQDACNYLVHLGLPDVLARNLVSFIPCNTVFIRLSTLGA